MKLSANASSCRESPVRSSVTRALHALFAPLSPQTPSLPDARPRSDRFRCGGRESNFLADLKAELERQDRELAVCFDQMRDVDPDLVFAVSPEWMRELSADPEPVPAPVHWAFRA